MVDKDLAQIFRNAFPNTLDTTIRWHVNGSTTPASKKSRKRGDARWEGAQTFIVTGDINAEWLRDSTNQLAPYQALAKHDDRLRTLILGAINTQAEYVIESPYCNAFQPPPPSGLGPTANGQDDTVHPAYEPSFVFECKYELDSLAHFLLLGNQFYEHTGSTEFLTDRWYTALDALLGVLDAQSQPTFNAQGRYVTNQYTFQRLTTAGTETLSLDGIGNPLAAGTGLIRSAFRPSDDATILGFLIPANAMMSVQLTRTADVVEAAGGRKDLVATLRQRGANLRKAVLEHGVVHHSRYGDVFAFEVDGYGSQILMDDANIPSLLSLPLLGFVDRDDRVYQNTRKMILSQDGNPYYLTGSAFHGIGGPHSKPLLLPPHSPIEESPFDPQITDGRRSRPAQRLAHVPPRAGPDLRLGRRDRRGARPRARLEPAGPRPRVRRRRQHHRLHAPLVRVGQLALRADHPQGRGRAAAPALRAGRGAVCH